MSYSLTEREKEVLLWAAHGKSKWEIAVIISITEATVKFHANNVMRKTGTTNVTSAVARCITDGVLKMDEINSREF